MKLDWKAGAFKQKLLANVVSNGELVGQFLESDARRRLLALPELDTRLDGRRYIGGGVYRRYVAGLISNEVETRANEVTVRVGVKPGRTGDRHGLYIELGSVTAPARPFLRPAVFENAAKIVRLLEGK